MPNPPNNNQSNIPSDSASAAAARAADNQRRLDQQRALRLAADKRRLRIARTKLSDTSNRNRRLKTLRSKTRRGFANIRNKEKRPNPNIVRRGPTQISASVERPNRLLEYGLDILAKL